MSEKEDIFESESKTTEQTKVAPMEKIPFGKAIKDTVTLELTRPVLTRVRHRIKELQKIGRAKHQKETRGNVIIWHTTPPKVHMTGLSARIDNNVGVITYTKYMMEGENKKIKVTTSKSPFTDREIEVQAEYVQDCLMVETIEMHKPLRSEEVRV